ncbi:MAG: hypothetical protein LOD88_04800 [Novibacillus thermophilus]|jgi:Fe-S cluster assembly iron-binding protein IscA|uniref:FeS cluster biogenesis domain-containing protein n=1 Tax=Novibacillus thermophilus TaxID=1471761 RepID=A0A1U9K4G7_9BACL|nr:hypothetical protein [Novibacillus thermophilus]AQS54941.1 hypothetical protein B0W44_03290 [Novibacillus thermophilus]
MGQTLGPTSERPAVNLSQLAALKLKMILLDEPDAERLCYRVVPVTSGCGSTAFQLTLTEKRDGDHIVWIKDIPFSYTKDDLPLLDGLAIDLNRQSGKLEFIHRSYQPDHTACCSNR